MNVNVAWFPDYFVGWYLNPILVLSSNLSYLNNNNFVDIGENKKYLIKEVFDKKFASIKKSKDS